MITWPEGKKCAVMFTFDMDAETLWTSRNPASWNSPETMSQGTYGPLEGVPRILKLFEKYKVKTSFFIPGWVMERHPGVCKEIHDRGHDIGYHSYDHAFNKGNTLEQEKATLEKCEEIFEKYIGCRPIGVRSPMGDLLPGMEQILLDKGYIYASDMKHTDTPYFHELNGKEIPLVELPTKWMYDDSSYYFFTLQEPVRRGIAPGSHLYEVWSEEFDGMYEEGKSINYVNHPQISGTPSRIKTLDRLLDHITSCDGAWVASCREVAEYMIKIHPSFSAVS